MLVAQVSNGLTKAFQSGVNMHMYYSSQGSGGHWGATPDQLDREAPKYAGLRALLNTMITRNVGTILPGNIPASPTISGVDTNGIARPQYQVARWNCVAAGSEPEHCSNNGTAAVGSGPAYLVTVTQAGTYTVSLDMDDIQTNNAGSVELEIDAKPAGIFAFPQTAAGTPLTAGPLTVTLIPGLHLVEIKVASSTGGFAIDSINFASQ